MSFMNELNALSLSFVFFESSSNHFYSNIIKLDRCKQNGKKIHTLNATTQLDSRCEYKTNLWVCFAIEVFRVRETKEMRADLGAAFLEKQTHKQTKNFLGRTNTHTKKNYLLTQKQTKSTIMYQQHKDKEKKLQIKIEITNNNEKQSNLKVRNNTQNRYTDKQKLKTKQTQQHILI